MSRVWFINKPSGVVDFSQRSQLAIGYGGTLVNPIINEHITYFKRYLDDPATVGFVGPPITPASGTETDETRYLRRYLQD